MSTFLRAVLWAGFIGLIGFLVYLVFYNMPGQVIVLVAAALLLLATRFGDLVKFKLSGMSVEADLEKIRSSLVELHHLAELFGRISLQQMQGAGRWGGYSQRERDSMRRSIVDGLKRVGLDQKRIDRVLEAEWPFFHFDYASRVTSAANKKRGSDTNEEWNTFMGPHSKGIGSEADPENLRAFFEKLGILDDELRSLLADYEHFHTHKTHRSGVNW
ncbi:hypothetical protein I7G59_09595 [Sinorhizobium meliloti]|uniref:hypothetical protein n=1 Tax=Rhizobium meliloti TaxID=382 RepID=UPI0023803F32|nr:hypothetical protein [Sinorhizobium meliloti]MDE3797579.1 hypothetical protein [Sinorhizobium meliloti]